MSITDHINASGFSREEICRKAGLSRSMLSMIERGDRKASPDRALALAAALNVHPAEIRPDLAAFASSGNAA